MSRPEAPTLWGSSVPFSSPLRYPGGKGRLGPWLGELIRANGLVGGTYVEPYAGGAGAAFHLLRAGLVRNVLINDADPVVYSFWRIAVHRTDELVKLIRERPVTMDTWLSAKEVLASPERYRQLEVAFATFFLNRTSRSGILNGGVIGGKAQAGFYKLNARYNVDGLVGRIMAIGACRERITVSNRDALALLEQRTATLPKKTLIYLDPPYYGKGSQLYRNFYLHSDHVAIGRAVRKLVHPIVITYDDCNEIRKIYHGVAWSSFSLQYSTHLERPTATEVMFYANLTLPMAPMLSRGSALTTRRNRLKLTP